jgi:hypothetical protein
MARSPARGQTVAVSNDRPSDYFEVYERLRRENAARQGAAAPPHAPGSGFGTGAVVGVVAAIVGGVALLLCVGLGSIFYVTNHGSPTVGATYPATGDYKLRLRVDAGYHYITRMHVDERSVTFFQTSFNSNWGKGCQATDSSVVFADGTSARTIPWPCDNKSGHQGAIYGVCDDNCTPEGVEAADPILAFTANPMFGTTFTLHMGYYSVMVQYHNGKIVN